MNMQGIDISKYQGSDINFNTVKQAGKKFVLIKAGYGKYISQKEPTFETHYKGAKNAGLHVGAYWYSYAKSIEEAKEEAKVCLEIIKGKQFDMPIYYDFEESSQFQFGKAHCSDLITAFCDALEKAGYYAGIYIYRAALQEYVTPEVATRYSLAVAEYGPKLNYDKPVGVWQYKGGEGRCPGVNGPCDLDICYEDFPTIIVSNGLNGYAKVPTSTLKKSDEEIAIEVIQGDWGAGEKRKKLLTEAGYDYDSIQVLVNDILNAKPTKTIDVIAIEVIQGKWSAGEDRRIKLTAAGYDYNVVQERVNELLKE